MTAEPESRTAARSYTAAPTERAALAGQIVACAVALGG